MRLRQVMLVVAGLILTLPDQAQAQNYPTRPIRLISPFAAGGANDVLARALGAKLADRLGATVVIENRPGAGAVIGITALARSAPDGYTLVLSGSTLAVTGTLYKQPPFDAIKDFAPVMLVGTAPQIMVANPSFAYSSLKELLALPRAQTEKIAMGTSGTGSSPHMTYELLRLRTGLTLNHIPYKGGGPATADALAGQIPLAFNAAPASMTYLRANRLKGLGITSAKRHPLVPNVPTFIEAGVPDFTVAHWYGVLAPAGTPPAIIKTLHAEILKSLQLPDVKERFGALAIDTAAIGPQEFAKIIEADVKRWREVVTKSGLRIE